MPLPYQMLQNFANQPSIFDRIREGEDRNRKIAADQQTATIRDLGIQQAQNTLADYGANKELRDLTRQNALATEQAAPAAAKEALDAAAIKKRLGILDFAQKMVASATDETYPQIRQEINAHAPNLKLPEHLDKKWQQDFVMTAQEQATLALTNQKEQESRAKQLKAQRPDTAKSLVPWYGKDGTIYSSADGGRTDERTGQAIPQGSTTHKPTNEGGESLFNGKLYLIDDPDNPGNKKQVKVFTDKSGENAGRRWYKEKDNTKLWLPDDAISVQENQSSRSNERMNRSQVLNIEKDIRKRADAMAAPHRTVLRNVTMLQTALASGNNALIDTYVQDVMSSLSPSKVKAMANLSRYRNPGGVFRKLSGWTSRFTGGQYPESTRSEIADLSMELKQSADQTILDIEESHRWLAESYRDLAPVESGRAVPGKNGPNASAAEGILDQYGVPHESRR